jgi:hypothetical protein
VVSSPVVIESSAAPAASGCPGCAPGVSTGGVQAGAARPALAPDASPAQDEGETEPVPGETIQGEPQPSA